MDEQITISQALNNLQSWLNAGEYDRVAQGCMEVLKLEPGNQRALALMKQAEERRFSNQATTPTFLQDPTPVATSPTPVNSTLPTQTPTPLADPSPANQIATAPRDPYGLHHLEEDEEESKFKLFLAILVPALLVILVAGTLLFFLTNRKPTEDQETILDNLPSTHYLVENEKRVENLTLIAKALEDFKNDNGAYPSVEQVENVIVDSEYFEELPIDPRHGGLDNAGNTFGYIYAVYPSNAGENTVYIISALFEDSEGFGYSWTQGTSPRNYPDYMDLAKENVVLIGAEEPKIKR